MSTYIPRYGAPNNSVDPVQTITATANGIVQHKRGIVKLAHASVGIAATFPSLTEGADFVFMNTLGGTHTITLPSGYTYDGTNNRATLDTANEFIYFKVVSSSRVLVLASSGVVYSAV